jgi:hypothetical protein
VNVWTVKLRLFETIAVGFHRSAQPKTFHTTNIRMARMEARLALADPQRGEPERTSTRREQASGGAVDGAGVSRTSSAGLKARQEA